MVRSALPIPETYRPGDTVFSSWVISDVLGSGGFSTVYEAVSGTGGKCALKVITLSLDRLAPLFNLFVPDTEAAALVRRQLTDMEQEVSRLRTLRDCQNIVRLDDFCVNEGPDGKSWQVLMRMEKLRSLEDFMRTSSPGPEQTAARVGTDIARALEACHAVQVVHRNIKPVNIMVGPSGQFELCDFGISRLTEKGISQNGLHMAPEIFHDRPYDHTVDIYALGLTLYQLLNDNLPPFCSPTGSMTEFSQAIVRRLSGEALPPPRNCGNDLSRIILKACQFDPQSRYQDAASLRRDLEAWQAEHAGADKAFPFSSAHPVRLAKTDDRRLALVIGNADYIASGKLRNTIHDAMDMAQALKDLRFDVIVGTDLTLQGMLEKQEEFLRRLSGYDTTLLFFSGHGSQIAGSNLLIPTDLKLNTAPLQEAQTPQARYAALKKIHDDFLAHAFSFDQYLRFMAGLGREKIHICILDCCRTNPFAIDNMKIQSFDGDTLRAVTPVDTVISYATSPDEPSLDGTARSGHGTYTGRLLRHIADRDVKIEDMLKRVRVEVARETHGQQITWEHSSLMQDFYFNYSQKRDADIFTPREEPGPFTGTCPFCQAQLRFTSSDTVTCRFCRQEVSRTQAGGNKR